MDITYYGIHKGPTDNPIAFTESGVGESWRRHLACSTLFVWMLASVRRRRVIDEFLAATDEFSLSNVASTILPVFYVRHSLGSSS